MASFSQRDLLHNLLTRILVVYLYVFTAMQVLEAVTRFGFTAEIPYAERPRDRRLIQSSTEWNPTGYFSPINNKLAVAKKAQWFSITGNPRFELPV